MKQIHKKCLICSSTNLRELLLYSNEGLIQCVTCKFVFSKNIPSQKELSNHYDTYPRTNLISPITIKRYHELLDTFEEYRLTNNILDVGCGDGHFLEVAKQRGWNIYGTEFTDKAIELCLKKGINIKKGILNIADFKELAFDIITSFEVIEHINNPMEELNKFNILLRKNGLLYITTPNFNSLSRYYLKQNWNVIEYPEHLCYYTKKTLIKLAKINGFSELNFYTTGFSFSRFQNSISDKNNNNPVNKDDVIRLKSETNWHYKLAKQFVNYLLTIFKNGDSIKAYFLKN